MTTTSTELHTENATSATASVLSLTDRAKAIGPLLAEQAARHDAEGSFVDEAYVALREAGLT